MAQLTNLASNCKSKLNSISSLQGSMESMTISKEALNINSKPSRQTHSPRNLLNSLNEDRIM